MCAGTRLCVSVYVYVLGQRRVRVLYIAITLLFLPLTVIAKMIAGGEFWWGGGCCSGGGGMVREAGRCSVQRVRPGSWLVSISLSGGLDWMDEGAGECGRPGGREAFYPPSYGTWHEGGAWRGSGRWMGASLLLNCVRLSLVHGHIIIFKYAL